jgi:5,10-methylenetetrahydromethanopterin reductase
MTSPAALYLQDAHPISEGMQYAKYAEEKGFEAVWQADSRLVRDAIVPMSAFAAVTDKIKIGSGVVDCWTRNPARLAATFSTLDDLAPGRVILGIGAWWDARDCDCCSSIVSKRDRHYEWRVCTT